MNNTIDAYRAEVFRLSRPTTLRWSLAGAVIYGVVVTAVLVATAADTGSAMLIPTLEANDGATAPLVLATSFSSVLVLGLITPMAAGDLADGSMRAALLQNPNRLSVAGGFFAARLVGLTVLVATVFVVSWATAFVVASGSGLDISAWSTADGLEASLTDFVRTMLYVAVWALLGTVVGIVTRSVAVGLAIGVMWAGPLENVLGDDLAVVQKWAPGLLLQDVLTGSGDFSAAHIGGTLVVYAVAAIALSGVLLTRRDVV
ncbi:MAG: hypothetical protein ACK5RL_10910 [Acidimicrobiales bacterium]